MHRFRRVDPPTSDNVVAELRRQLAEVTRERDELLRDVKHAVSETKRREPDYPFGEETASECVWCLGEGLLGVTRACDEWTERCQSAERERDDLRDQSVMTIHGLTAERNALSTKLAKAEADAAAMRRTMTENESRLKDVIRRIGVSTTTGWITHELNHVLLDIPSGTAGRELLDRHKAKLAAKDAEIEQERKLSRSCMSQNARLVRKSRTAKTALFEHYRGKIDPAWFGDEVEQKLWSREPKYGPPKYGRKLIWRVSQAGVVESLAVDEPGDTWDESVEFNNESDLNNDKRMYRCNADGTPLAKSDDDAALLRKLRELLRGTAGVCVSLTHAQTYIDTLIAIRDGGKR